MTTFFMTNDYKDHPHRPSYAQKKPMNAGKNADGALLSKAFVFESNGPAGKIRGTALQLMEKYGAFAKDAQREGDSVQSQNFLQHAEHYRVISAAQNAASMVSSHSHVSPPRISPIHTSHQPHQTSSLPEKKEPQSSEEKKSKIEETVGQIQESPSHDKNFEHVRAPRVSKKLPHLNRPKILRNHKKPFSPSETEKV